MRLVALVCTAVLVGAGAAAIALVLTREEDRAPVIAGQLIADSERHMQETVAVLDRATSLAGIRLAGDEAGRRSSEVLALLDRTERVLAGKAALAEPVERVLASEAAALASLAPAEQLTAQRLDQWSSILADIHRSAAELSLGHTRMRMPPSVRRPKDQGPSLLAAATKADTVVRRGRRLLAGWRRRYSNVRRERRHELAVLDAYESTMSSHLETYDGLRDDMSAWIGRVDRGAVTFDEGYEFLSEASAARTRVRRGIAALDAPAALAAEHNTLLAVVDAGVAAVDAAYDGTIDYEFDFLGEYDSYRETPGWRTFTQQSASVAQRYATALADWRAAFAKERKTTSDRALPKAPNL